MPDVVLVQLRLRPEEAAGLREAAMASGRSLPGEIRHRANMYREHDADLDVSPVGKPVAGIDQGIAQLTRYLANTAQIFRDPSRERAAYLGIVKAALDRALTDLGATEPDKDDTGAAEGIASVAFRSLQNSEPDQEHSSWRWPEIKRSLLYFDQPEATTKPKRPTRKGQSHDKTQA